MAVANSLCLLKSNPPTLKCFPARFSMLPPTRPISAHPSFPFVRTQNELARLSVYRRQPIRMSSKPITSDRSRTNPVESIVDKIIGAVEALQKPAVMAILIGLLLSFDVGSALAASGGRVGGSSFSRRSRSSSSYSSYRVRSRRRRPSSSFSAAYYDSSLPGGRGLSFWEAAEVFIVVLQFVCVVLQIGVLVKEIIVGDRTTVLKLQV